MLYQIHTASMDGDRKHKAEMRTSARPQALNKIKKTKNTVAVKNQNETKTKAGVRTDAIVSSINQISQTNRKPQQNHKTSCVSSQRRIRSLLDRRLEQIKPRNNRTQSLVMSPLNQRNRRSAPCRISLSASRATSSNTSRLARFHWLQYSSCLSVMA
ncbi:hypothetical protein BDV32DRAFT_43899 [Aspergillus pseudonomiae]|uniref:Uncharacterized protein n=1 Tax=Aspergillus pseudonomiae TaxID=1506151 RepID=A0A5N7CV36_9EURO|nr:uncharacterized protein BDV37DRAFT_48394 [Aspergillus pseudonomiae]KAB8260945.1 hypothetical protein BDV32DRAFT_43899 [Aspergillus pseudonomiae]KAE8397829.1 hypothetical protein BDV37DRAFT_48394 [Aspergillus pseudonomiae]